MICILQYETVKYVSIKDTRLGIMRTSLLLGIVIYVGIVEMWGQGGWLEQSPVVGVVRFSLQQPTIDNCDPNKDPDCQNAFVSLSELAYCTQSTVERLSNYPGTKYDCQIYEATNAQLISEKSISILTRASIRIEHLVCQWTDLICPRTYNMTSSEQKFYIAQSEAFTILFDHAVTASRICESSHGTNYACSSESSRYIGRLYSVDSSLCADEYAKGNAYANVRGSQLSPNAPCYIHPNITKDKHDFLSLEVLLRAAGGWSLDDCAILSENGTCISTYRETGATLLLNLVWSDFQYFHGHVEPFYYYAPQLLLGSTFQQTIPYYKQYRTSRTLLKAHGIRIAVLLSGSFHQFRFVSFLVTLTTALGLLAVATTIVDGIMLYLLPEKERYQHLKYEDEQQQQQQQQQQQIEDSESETQGTFRLEQYGPRPILADTINVIEEPVESENAFNEPLLNSNAHRS
jgi:hypothetical protein